MNSVSSTDSASSVRLGVSGEHRPLRMPRCKSATACKCWRSAAEAKSHHELNNLKFSFFYFVRSHSVKVTETYTHMESKFSEHKVTYYVMDDCAFFNLAAQAAREPMQNNM